MDSWPGRMTAQCCRGLAAALRNADARRKRLCHRRLCGTLAREGVTPIVAQPKLSSVCVLSPSDVVQVAGCGGQNGGSRAGEHENQGWHRVGWVPIRLPGPTARTPQRQRVTQPAAAVATAGPINLRTQRRHQPTANTWQPHLVSG